MCISNHNKKEWNLVVLNIVSSLDYQERILSYMCINGSSLRQRRVCGRIGYGLLVLKWLKSQEGGLNCLVKNLGYLCKLKTTFK